MLLHHFAFLSFDRFVRGLIAGFAFAVSLRAAETVDLVVFGATPAGVSAAVMAARQGDKVVLLEPSYLVGGMMAGGLTKTDLNKRAPYGGMPREFFERVVAYYRKTYGAESSQVKECSDGFAFEPKVAGQIFRAMLADAKVEVRTKERLESVAAPPGRIEEISTRNYESGALTTFKAAQFIDATYEGDLMALAGVLYRLGRESRTEYDESLAGLTEGPAEYIGMGDHRVQAYNIRGTLTNDVDVRLPIPKPQTYSREAHAGYIAQVKRHRLRSIEELFDVAGRWAVVNGKGDPNKADFTGVNIGYTEGDYDQRARITARVQDHWLSLWYMLQNDPELPEEFKTNARRWGLPKDEFIESGHVTPQIYVRTARRMQGRYMLTQRDLFHDRHKPDTIAQGSYYVDSHQVQRIQTAEGLRGEGGLNGTVDPYEIPYRCITPHGVRNLLVVGAVSATNVAYSSLRMEPVFMMIGHAAGVAAHLARVGRSSVQEVSIADLQQKLVKDGIPLVAPYRPTLEIRRTTAGPVRAGDTVEFELVPRDVRRPLTRLAWNFDGSGEVQATTPTAKFTFAVERKTRVMLIAADDCGAVSLPAVLDLAVGSTPAPDITITADHAELTGRWGNARGVDMEYRFRLGRIDTQPGSGLQKATFAAIPSRSGRYRVCVMFPSGHNRATNVPIRVTHAGGETRLVLDQRKKNAPFAAMPIGVFRFDAGRPASVTLSNEGTNGHVVCDAVTWLWIEE